MLQYVHPRFRFGIACAAILFGAAIHAARADVFNMPGGQTSLQFVSVGNPGNAPDPATGGTAGSVGYQYQMGKYDVTLAQYTQFLNAVAKTDTYGVYSSFMVDGGWPFGFGISQSGSSGSYTYAVTGSNSQAGNMPLTAVNWGDAARFCNWLQNGQPTGPEGNGTTETGAYTLNGDTMTLSESRNAGATYFIPTENEWYKAAYYDPSLNSGSGGYWTYATRSNLAPNNSLVLAATSDNDANYQLSNYTDPTNFLTPVGTFAASPSAYGTFDQDGDVRQWNETRIGPLSRGVRGGSFLSDSSLLASSGRQLINPRSANAALGFRVASAASVPEPGGVAITVAAASALGMWMRFARRRRRVLREGEVPRPRVNRPAWREVPGKPPRSGVI